MNGSVNFILWILLFFVVPSFCRAQISEAKLLPGVIAPYPFSIGCRQTSNIIFPYSIKSVDRGTSLVLVQKAKGVENILQLKGAEEHFSTTTLSVVTGEGKFYSFVVSYDSQPPVLNLIFYRDSVSAGTVALMNDSLHNEKLLDQFYQRALKAPATIHLSRKLLRMRLRLRGIYFNQDLLWFCFRLRNRSLLAFTCERPRFIIRDHRRSKRTALQEREIYPIYNHAPVVVPGDSLGEAVLAFPAFTILPGQELLARFPEKNGGRIIELRIRNRHILRTILLP